MPVWKTPICNTSYLSVIKGSCLWTVNTSPSRLRDMKPNKNLKNCLSIRKNNMNGIKSLALFYVKAFQDLLTEEIKHLEREKEKERGLGFWHTCSLQEDSEEDEKREKSCTRSENVGSFISICNISESELRTLLGLCGCRIPLLQ